MFLTRCFVTTCAGIWNFLRWISFSIDEEYEEYESVFKFKESIRGKSMFLLLGSTLGWTLYFVIIKAI